MDRDQIIEAGARATAEAYWQRIAKVAQGFKIPTWDDLDDEERAAWREASGVDYDAMVPLIRQEPIRVIVVVDLRRGRVHGITCEQAVAQQWTRDLVAKYDGDQLAATMTVGLVTPGGAS